MPNSFAYNDDVKPIKQDLLKAKALLKEAGYDEKNPLVFEVVTNTGNDIRVNTAQILQYQLSKNWCPDENKSYGVASIFKYSCSSTKI